MGNLKDITGELKTFFSYEDVALELDEASIISLFCRFRRHISVHQSVCRAFLPPVDLQVVAALFGAKIKEAEMPAEGMLHNAGGSSPVIYCRWDRKEPRKRFTIAHELGHLFIALRYGREAYVRLRETNARSQGFNADEEEWMANAIAAELLMPANILHEQLQHAKEKSGCPRRRMEMLTSLFRVSTEAMAIRLSRCRYADYFRVSVPIVRETNSFKNPRVFAPSDFNSAFRKCHLWRQLETVVRQAQVEGDQRLQLFAMKTRGGSRLVEHTAVGFWGSNSRDGSATYHLVGWISGGSVSPSIGIVN